MKKRGKRKTLLYLISSLIIPITIPMPAGAPISAMTPPAMGIPAGDPIPDDASRETADSVKKELLHAWTGYKKYAWGYDALKPLSRTGHNWYARSLYMTPVDSYDLLLMMGLHEEAEQVKRLILDSLTFDLDMEIQAFEIVIRILGGLISAYEMDGDPRFRDLAVDLADRLLPIYQSATGIPYRYVNLKTGAIRDSVNNPAEIGTALLEFGKISVITGDPRYYAKAKTALRALHARSSDIGLVGTWINAETGEWTSRSSHIGGAIDSYYEYLVKCRLLFGDEECGAMWDRHEPAIHKYLADTVNGSLWYGSADMVTGERTGTRFGALHAFFPAVLCLTGDSARADALQRSAYAMWNLHGIEPELIDYAAMKVASPGYPLRPEIVESAYYLHLYTGDHRYLEMGRKIFADLIKHCRTDVAYAHLADVVAKEKTDAMESFFLAETMKYLYLLFTSAVKTPEDVIFNTEAHPFRTIWNERAPGPVPPAAAISNDDAPALAPATQADFEAKLEKARIDFASDTTNSGLLIWVGRRTAYLGRYDEAIRIYSKGLAANPVYAPLYRHRGHRYITVRMFDRAIDDLESASRLIEGVPDRVEEDGLPNRFNVPTSTLHSNIYYHLGLAYYLSGDFASAEQNFRRCVELSGNDDMLCAASDWLYMSCRRQGKEAEAEEVLKPIKEGMTVYEDSAYYNRLLMYKGLRKPEALFGISFTAGNAGTGGGGSRDTNEVTIATYGYGVGNWYLYNGKTGEAEKIFQLVLKGKNRSAFGYIAAEAEVARGLKGAMPRR